jgi:hypothetical protein
MTPALMLLALLPLDLAATSEKNCVLPEHPPKLVLGVERYLLPIGGDVRREAGEVTAVGDCTPKTECVKVGEGKMAQLLATVRALEHVRYKRDPVSPHYGSRTVYVRWRGGECQISDGREGQIDPRDSERFYAAMGAIGDAIVAGRTAAKP